jgi:N-acetylmuramoyl-L-alanine amidase
MPRVRRIALVAVLLALALPGVAAAAEVTLEARPATADYESVVHFSGAVTGAEPGALVLLYEQKGEGWHRVVNGHVKANGTYRLAARVVAPGTYVVRTLGGESAPVTLMLRPRLKAALTGAPVLGGELALAGRILPARAGTITVTVNGKRRRADVGAAGRFRVPLTTRGEGLLTVRLSLRPAQGFTAARRTLRARIAQPSLAMGSRGLSVLALERRLAELGYAIKSADSVYGYDTFEAVLAFQKMNMTARTGRVDARLWRLLGRARTPRPRAGGGDHLEIDKSRQVLFEVRDNKVVTILHVSTGATGNTPVGRWHVYRKVAGWDWVLWYPMYFLRGFAIHGYPSVPAYPASHGCVRVPMWFAASLYSRWPMGATVWVFP